MKTTQTEMKPTKLQLAAINQYVESNIPSAEEKTITGKDFVIWGTNNTYPEYLYYLYKNVSTLHSIIEGTTDYICGDAVTIDDELLNVYVSHNGDKLSKLIRDISTDLLIYNGFAINVLRNKFGDICSLVHIPMQRIRTNSEKTKFYYSEDWTKSYGRVKSITLPKFDPNQQQMSSIYYYCNNNLGVYPIPSWSGAIKAAEIEMQISDYHLNSICNGFSSSYIINFNNGVPTDEQKTEIEKYVNEKFSGAANAGRIVLAFNDGKDRSVELSKLETDDFGEKYKTLSERTKQELFTSFRAIPNLFGLPTATGFSTEEYEQAFKLYNRTVVKPKQKIICDAIYDITGKNVDIAPFALG